MLVVLVVLLLLPNKRGQLKPSGEGWEVEVGGAWCLDSVWGEMVAGMDRGRLGGAKDGGRRGMGAPLRMGV